MAADPILVTKAPGGPAHGTAVPVSGLVVRYGGQVYTTSTVGTTYVTMVPSGFTGATFDLKNGGHHGLAPRVTEDELNAVRGPDWPGGTGDVKFNTTPSYPADTRKKAVYLDGTGQTVSVDLS